MKGRDWTEARKRRGRSELAAFLLMWVMLIAAVTIILLEVTGPHGGEVSSPGPQWTTTTRALATAGTASTTTEVPSSSTSSTTMTSTTTTTIYTHPIADPVRIVIPAIKVDAKVIPVGLLENGNLEVPPFGLAAWYRLGPTPGAAGPAVIVAHVDSKKGPDVFYHLRELEPGDEVRVYSSDGDVATFVVDSKEQQLKVDLPVERIWNEVDEPLIRLITCGGDFDRSLRGLGARYSRATGWCL